MQYGNDIRGRQYVVENRFKSYYVVWKPFSSIQCGVFRVGFKSYYVVWKPTHPKISQKRLVCLNRTMQYGNPLQLFLQLYTDFGFKSYYVVWKLFFNCIPHHRCGMFKSYYVVWKHSSSESRPNMLSRLNRTMQYGNFHHTRCPPFYIQV